MSKYLLCYEVGHAPEDSHTAGSCIMELESLTELMLDVARDLIKKDVSAKYPNIEFTNVVWRSVTRLDG